MPTPSTRQFVAQRISAPRLSRYLAAADGNLDVALSLYERNTRLSEAFYTPLQALEICLRNVIHEQMTVVYSASWLLSDAVPFHSTSLSMIDGAMREREKHGDPNEPNGLVSVLSFAFWVGLLGPAYDATIWRRALYRGFRATGARRRQEVHMRLDSLRRLRNRIAHHEPIFARDTLRDHDEIIEAIGWMCADTSAWARQLSRVPTVLGAAGPA